MNDVLNQLAGKTVETLSVWADANQKVVQAIAEFTAGTTKEGIRLYAELQQNALKSFGEAPVGQFPQKTFELVESNAQAVSRAAERLQASADKTGKDIQQTWSGVADKLKAVYSSQN